VVFGAVCDLYVYAKKIMRVQCLVHALGSDETQAY
jgi:hypothetical protein